MKQSGQEQGSARRGATHPNADNDSDLRLGLLVVLAQALRLALVQDECLLLLPRGVVAESASVRTTSHNVYTDLLVLARVLLCPLEDIQALHAVLLLRCDLLGDGLGLGKVDGLPLLQDGLRDEAEAEGTATTGRALINTSKCELSTTSTPAGQGETSR